MANKLNPFEDPKMRDYFMSIPDLIQESILQSGVRFYSESDLRKFVENLQRPQ
jgi:hypothetical protein